MDYSVSGAQSGSVSKVDYNLTSTSITWKLLIVTQTCTQKLLVKGAAVSCSFKVCVGINDLPCRLDRTSLHLPQALCPALCIWHGTHAGTCHSTAPPHPHDTPSSRSHSWKHPRQEIWKERYHTRERKTLVVQNTVYTRCALIRIYIVPN